MNQAADPNVALASDVPSRWGIQTKVFSLVMVAVLLPTALVGTASYWTARDVLMEKLTDRLRTRASLAAASVAAWFKERDHDASVFASSSLVTSSNPALIEAYLVEVHARFPFYSGLAVLSTEGAAIATVGEIREVEPMPATLTIDWRHDPPGLLTQNPIRESDGTVTGYFVMTCDFDSLGAELVYAASSERLILVSAYGSEDRVVMVQPPDTNPPRAGSYAVDEDTLTERRGPGGSRMLATARSVDVPELGERLIVHVETDRRAAFAAVHELRNRIIAISAIVAVVVISLAFGLAVSLTRPLESLTQGANAVSNGDYSLVLPVRTRDEIGYLTKVFNRMTATLKESHERLEYLSTTDELTKLVNRRQLRTVLVATLQRAKRSEEPFSLIMIDIDHFKAFNDKFGHVKGDELLSNLGSFLLANLRATDVAARYGGEEFLVILPDTPIEEAGTKAQSIRTAFPASYDAMDKVTLSLGVAAWRRDGSTVEAIIEAADRALYSAKKQGRDRVVVACNRSRQRTSER